MKNSPISIKARKQKHNEYATYPKAQLTDKKVKFTVIKIQHSKGTQRVRKHYADSDENTA